MFVSIRRANRQRLAAGERRSLPWKGFVLSLLGLLAGFVFVYLWSHIQVWQLTVEQSRLRREKVRLSAKHRQLRLELAGLMNPSRLERLNELHFHLAAPLPGQVEERP
ncbi:MAG: cell division protein FtsL [Proteobacteria bacterium]|nr:cell division protein FtsL [Pseudomonadota bacterium]MBU1741554.1 cell division protein FtsL [Pseudomonadota bacterium]